MFIWVPNSEKISSISAPLYPNTKTVYVISKTFCMSDLMCAPVVTKS